MTLWRTRPQRLLHPSPQCRSGGTARQGQHGRDLVPSGTSLLAAVQAQAGGL